MVWWCAITLSALWNYEIGTTVVALAASLGFVATVAAAKLLRAWRRASHQLAKFFFPPPASLHGRGSDIVGSIRCSCSDAPQAMGQSSSDWPEKLRVEIEVDTGPIDCDDSYRGGTLSYVQRISGVLDRASHEFDGAYEGMLRTTATFAYAITVVLTAVVTASACRPGR